MRVPVPTWAATLNFDALGRTLRHFAGAHARVEMLALVPGEIEDHVQALPLGVLTGPFRLLAEEEMPESKAPPEAIEPGERAHLIEIGGGLLPISGVDLIGATFDADDGILRWMVGPVVFHMGIEGREE